MAFTVTDFAVDSAHATLGDPHELTFPLFNNLQLTVYGSFNTSKCYEMSIKHEGGKECGSAHSSGNDVAVVFADHLIADILPTQQNADFKGRN